MDSVEYMLALLCVFFVALSGQSEGSQDMNETFIDHMDKVLMTGGSALKYEQPQADRPTKVELNLYVYFMDVNTLEETMELGVYFRMSWNDPRLAFDSASIGNGYTMSYTSDHKEHLWIPDVFISNSKSVEEASEANQNLRISSNGNMFLVQRVRMKLHCPMKLNKFPNDKQSCPIRFESFGYTMDTLHFAWATNGAIDLDSSIEMKEYTLETSILNDCSQNYSTGAYPCYEIRLQLQRDTGYYVRKTFLPSCGIMVLSWLIFFIDGKQFGIRLILGTMLAYMLCGIQLQTMQMVPTISYLTMCDIWSTMCMLFLVAVLIESLLVKVWNNRNESNEQNSKGVAKLELLFKMIFPAVFILFMIIFFAIYYA